MFCPSPRYSIPKNSEKYNKHCTDTRRHMKMHFVLIHGVCMGAWCWYKLMPLLRAAGHHTTALDLSGCGSNPRRLNEIVTVHDYLEPLMEFMTSLPQGEKVILVGHSFGGIGVSLAIQKFPEKVLFAVFVAAYMPNCSSPILTVIEETFKRTPLEDFLDTTFRFDNAAQSLPTSIILGPDVMAKKFYQHCEPQDLELGKMLVRPNGLFCEDLAKECLLTPDKFGSVGRVFIICEEDQMVKADFQQWMIENSPPKVVKSIPGADHMAMLSKPEQLCLRLLEVTDLLCAN